MSQVLFAFMVGLHNLYWYYGSQTYKQEGTDKLVHTSEAFQGSVHYVILFIMRNSLTLITAADGEHRGKLVLSPLHNNSFVSRYTNALSYPIPRPGWKTWKIAVCTHFFHIVWSCACVQAE